MATDSRSSNLMKMKANTSTAGPSSSKTKFDSSPSKKKTIIKKTSSSQSKTVTTTVTKTREKKVYSLPGQKYDVPEEREPLRIFYESLSNQIPSSEMAEFWMMEHGLLSTVRAKKAFEKKQRKQKQLRSGMPIKSPPPRVITRPEVPKKSQPVPKNSDVKAKKRILSDSDDDDDFVLSHRRRKG